MDSKIEPVAWTSHANLKVAKQEEPFYAAVMGSKNTPEMNVALYTGRQLAAALAAAEQRGRESERAALGNVEVEWVVNDIAELGVKIGNQFFFLYKGGSLTYTAEEGDSTPLHEDGSPMHWRPVFKREFGECCHPINYSDLTLIGTVSLSDSEDWKELPAAKEVGSPLRLSELVAAIRKGE